MKKSVCLLVEERVLLCAEATRTLTVEVDSDWNPDLLGRQISEGESDFGPFTNLFQVTPGTGYLESISLRVVGSTDEPADIPRAAESEVGR